MNNIELQTMQSLLIKTLLEDLGTPIKCTPALYTVIRGVLNDNKEAIYSIPSESMASIEAAMRKALPFQSKTPELFHEAESTPKDVYGEGGEIYKQFKTN